MLLSVPDLQMILGAAVAVDFHTGVQILGLFGV